MIVSNGFTKLAQDLVSHICQRIENVNPWNPELLSAFRNAPCTTLYDRLIAFRTIPYEGDFRAAVERIEKGSFGRCTLCGKPIPAAELRDSLLMRYCGECLGKLGSGQSNIQDQHEDSSLSR